jgi:hypothetical protein
MNEDMAPIDAMNFAAFDFGRLRGRVRDVAAGF